MQSEILNTPYFVRPPKKDGLVDFIVHFAERHFQACHRMKQPCLGRREGQPFGVTDTPARSWAAGSCGETGDWESVSWVLWPSVRP